ncbi:salt stress protein, Slr1339 family [Allocoleopsis sp.]|uniref:salt stress protein, Slr1339 family n=1 Tax=Allocoleopsis sp. TaxID=3088169 RepID=UPI002FD255BF
MESIDDLLAQVKAEYQEKESGLKPEKQTLFQEEDFKSPPPVSSTYQSQLTSSKFLTPAEENLLADVRAEFEEKERSEELKRQQQVREEQFRKEQQLREQQLREEQKRQRQREALTQEATEWLKKLNPRSEEGRWFEDFSYSYPSKLEAAIDYLSALRETHG